MSALKMTYATSYSRLLPCMMATAMLLFAAAANAAAPGITGLTFNLIAQPAYLNQPDGMAVYSWGYGCNGAPSGYAPAAITTGFCNTMQVPGPTLIVTAGTTVTVNLTNGLPAAAGNTSILFPGFTDMKDKYFLLNGRSYPDTVTPGPLATQSTDGSMHFSQPLSAIINIPVGKKALLRISDLDVSEYQTLASLGIPMQVIGYNAKLLRDQAGNNLYYKTNSITLAGGESLDVILDASNTTLYPSGSVFYLYTPNLDHLSNDAENFGGLMTEVHIN